MNSSPTWPTKQPDGMVESLAGGYVTSVPPPAKDDLSDWVELMEAVEALCPIWPERLATCKTWKNLL